MPVLINHICVLMQHNLLLLLTLKQYLQFGLQIFATYIFFSQFSQTVLNLLQLLFIFFQFHFDTSDFRTEQFSQTFHKFLRKEATGFSHVEELRILNTLCKNCYLPSITISIKSLHNCKIFVIYPLYNSLSILVFNIKTT